jgi:hypothetical protein
MTRKVLFMVAIGFPLLATAWAQQPEQPAPPPPPAPIPAAPMPTRVEAKAQVIVNWTLGNETWDFSDVLSVYEPVKGYLEIPSDKNESPKAVWTLRLVKNLESGTKQLHENLPGTPFEVTILDTDRAQIDPNPLPVKISPISGNAGDTILMAVTMPGPPLLNEVRFVRVERRTNVGF